MWVLQKAAQFETEIKRSRFIAFAARVNSMADTLDFYESVMDPSATHNCWAWRLDHPYRFNDDGEPGGTAGKPILAAIDGKELKHAMVVVTRYYGGTKLGVGGLIRAYGGTAARAIDQAGIIEELPVVNFELEAPFDCTGAVYAALDSLGAKREGERFVDKGVVISAEILSSDYEKLKSVLRDATRGQAGLKRL